MGFQDILNTLGGAYSKYIDQPVGNWVKEKGDEMTDKFQSWIDSKLNELKVREAEAAARPIPQHTFMGKTFGGPTATPTPTMMPTATPTPSPMPGKPTFDELVRTIEEGSKGDPVATMAAQMVREGQGKPVFDQHPFLPVSISQLESRGFKDFGVNPLVTKPKQGFGYGVNVQGYNPPIETVLSDMISAIGTDRAGEDDVRRRSASYYQDFRNNPSDIMSFANTYAGPITKQNPNAGETYGVNLKTVMNRYNEILDNKMKARGDSYPVRY